MLTDEYGNKLEGFVAIDDEVETCNKSNCKNKVVVSTVIEKKVKGLTVDTYHFWCEEHYKELRKVDKKRSEVKK